MSTSNPVTSVRLEPILDRYELPLVRYAYRLTTDLATARDVVQDVFLQLLRQTRPPSDDRMSAWLYRVCRNRAIDVARKRRRELGLAEGAWCTAYDDGGLAACEAVDGELLRAVAGLPALEQEVLWLRFADGLTYAEIGAATGKSASHVGVILHRAMVVLRGSLAPPPDAKTEGHER